MLRSLLLVAVAAGLFGCASRERVVLLPGPDGKVGTVVVEGISGRATLNTAYAAVDLADHKAQARTLSETEVRQRYGRALDALPQRPASFALMFLFDKAELMPESKGTIAAIVGEYSRRSAAEVVVIGHTDQTGPAQYNDDLSHRRAEAARDELIREGIPADRIEMQWRGDREPLPATARKDARNRRVDVKIR